MKKHLWVVVLSYLFSGLGVRAEPPTQDLLEVAQQSVATRSTPLPSQVSELLIKVGQRYEQQGDLTQARQAFRQAYLRDPQSGIAANHFIRIGVLMMANMEQENRQETQRFCQRVAQEPTAYGLSQCALALLQTEQPEQALLHIEQALSLAQNNTEKAYAHYLKGTILSHQEQVALAQIELELALRLQPPLSLQADIALALGFLTNDRVLLQQAKELDPTIAQVSGVMDLGQRQRHVTLTLTKKGKITFQDAYVPPIYRKLLVNGQPVLFMLDTGSAYTILSPTIQKRMSLRVVGQPLTVAYADGYRESLPRYQPDTVQLPGSPTRTLISAWLLGGKGQENLLGRDLLSQILSADWFTELRGN